MPAMKCNRDGRLMAELQVGGLDTFQLQSTEWSCCSISGNRVSKQHVSTTHGREKVHAPDGNNRIGHLQSLPTSDMLRSRGFAPALVTTATIPSRNVASSAVVYLPVLESSRTVEPFGSFHSSIVTGPL